MSTLEKTRQVYNPVQKDWATFLKTSEETQGEYTLLEVVLAPQGGNGLHLHDEFSECFEVVEGELNVQVGDEQKVLRVGEKALVQPNTPHRFFSTSHQPARFLVELRPGHTGFEQAIRIAYGLASDGKVNKEGVPTNILALAYLVQIGGTKLTGALALMQPLFSLLAKIARLNGLEKRFTEKYLQPF